MLLSFKLCATKAHKVKIVSKILIFFGMTVSKLQSEIAFFFNLFFGDMMSKL